MDRFSCLGNVINMVTFVLVIRKFRARQSFDQHSLRLQQVALLLQLRLFLMRQLRLLSPGEETIRACQAGAWRREHRSLAPVILLVVRALHES